MIYYKKAFMADGNDVIVKLEAEQAEPLGAGYPNGFLIKGRAKVLCILDMWEWETSFKECHSYHDKKFSYKVGKEVIGEHGIWCWGDFQSAVSYWCGAEGNKDPRYAKLARGLEA